MHTVSDWEVSKMNKNEACGRVPWRQCEYNSCESVVTIYDNGSDSYHDDNHDPHCFYLYEKNCVGQILAFEMIMEVPYFHILKCSV